MISIQNILYYPNANIVKTLTLFLKKMPFADSINLKLLSRYFKNILNYSVLRGRGVYHKYIPVLFHRLEIIIFNSPVSNFIFRNNYLALCFSGFFVLLCCCCFFLLIFTS